MPVLGESCTDIGKVIVLSGNPVVPFGVCTGEGVLGIARVQMEGKSEVAAADFIRGQRDFIGSVLSG